MENDKIIQQDTENKAPDRSMPVAFLLFEEKPHKINKSVLKEDFERLVGKTVDALEGENDSSGVMLEVKEYKGKFADMKRKVIPVAVFNEPEEYNADKLDELTLSQIWDVENGREVVLNSKYNISTFTMFAVMDYKEQSELFIYQIEALLMQYPSCNAVFMPASGNLISTYVFLDIRKFDMTFRFIKSFINIRFFDIFGKDDEYIVDSLGLFVYGLPDVQVYFKGLNPDDVVWYVINIVSHQYKNRFSIKNDEKIDGLDKDGNISRDVQWICQYKNSLIQPTRTVLDINCGQFAAGRRGWDFGF